MQTLKTGSSGIGVEAAQAATLDVDGVRLCRSADDAGRFDYVPGAPTPQRAPDGAPLVSARTFGATTLLQVGARWAILPEQLAAARTACAALAASDESRIELVPGHASVERAALTLTADDGSEHELATSETSGFPPFDAVFSVMLAAAAAGQVRRAFAGERGLLAVTYTISVPATVDAHATVRGAAGHLVAQLAEAGSEDVATAIVAAAIGDGSLRLREEADAAAPADLRAETRTAAVERAAAALVALARGFAPPDATAVIEAHADRRREVAGSERRSADLADWLTSASSTGAATPSAAIDVQSAAGTD